MPTTLRRLLTLLPTAIALLWILGITRFRHYELSAMEWASLAAAAFALQAMTRLQRPRPMPPLPPNTNPTTLSALAAAIAATGALLLGGVFEAILPAPETVSPWWLRTLWHGACTFGAAYCSFLLRLHQAPPAARR